MHFRADINGLRAWAVVLVMLYHFGVPGFSGGFVGVDVFFVISGYLMTSIILSKQASGGFSLLGFYLARARRIVPALLVLCAGLLGFGWFWLGAVDYKALGTHAGSALLFISNLTFANEAGYFDAQSHEKWLLHTWSLSVEWQFYLLYPLVLIGLTRSGRLSARVIVPAMLLVSLAYSLLLSHSDPSRAFYILPARAWELLAGGMVYLYGTRARLSRLPNAWVEFTGLALIVLAAIGVDMNNWPGPWTIMPVAGAVLVMLAHRQDSVFTSHPAIQALGRWSYSIYLWHWPLLVGALYFGLPRSLPLVFGLLFASVICGAMSFRYVEEPFRHTSLGQRVGWKGMFLLLLAVAVPAGVVARMRGIPERLPPALAQIEEQILSSKENTLKQLTGQSKCGWNKKSGHLTECRLGDPSVTPTIVVWGDSHAEKSMLAIHGAAKHNGLGVALYFRNGCRPLQGLMTQKWEGILKDCRKFNRKVLDRITANEQVDTVLLVANWSYDLGGGKVGDEEIQTYFGDAPLASTDARHKEYVEHVVADLCALKQSKKRVAVTAPLPYFGIDVAKSMARTYLFNGSARVPTIARREHDSRNQLLLMGLSEARVRCGVEILDPLGFFCDDANCYGARNGIPVFGDDNHLSKQGNALIQPLFDSYFRSAAAP